MPVTDGVARPAASVTAGLHCHLGSQITRPEAFEAAARRLTGLMAAVHAEHGVTLPELNLGGGHGVPYTEDDQDFDLAAKGDCHLLFVPGRESGSGIVALRTGRLPPKPPDRAERRPARYQAVAP